MTTRPLSIFGFCRDTLASMADKESKPLADKENKPLADKENKPLADKENRPLTEARSFRWISDSHGLYQKVSIDVHIMCLSQYHKALYHNNIIISQYRTIIIS